MKVQIINRQDKSKEVVEMLLLPNEGEQFEDREGRVMQVLQVTHTPFNSEVTARVLVGHRNSMGFV